MSKENEIAFLCKRLKELREKNNCTMDEMAQKLAVNGIAPNKSSISRVEAGKTSEKP
jgi:transcriptional regulator with XRE-family HTH domain